jgi:acetylornithine deacetylase/succinyl-diaminopimelate desuccinylase-like protein
MPDRTLGIDANYPVTHAQKAYGLITFRAQPSEKKGGSWRVAKMSGGSGNSIIPEGGEALVEWVGDGPQGNLEQLATRWASGHPPSKLTVTREGNLLKLTAAGKGGHTSDPSSGHDALGDLTAFLSTLDLRLDAWGSLAKFVGTNVGLETDGRSLGIAHAHPVMGPMTSILVFLMEEEGLPTARINIRVPVGIDQKQIEEKVAEKAAAFEGGKIVPAVRLFNQPHLVSTEGELVANLLAVWEEVTGTPGRAIAIGGGTQARLFKDGIDFGPAWPGVPYRGHGTDEYLTIEELHRIGELTVAALWRLGSAR